MNIVQTKNSAITFLGNLLTMEKLKQNFKIFAVKQGNIMFLLNFIKNGLQEKTVL
jgi:hypothetical protein